MWQLGICLIFIAFIFLGLAFKKPGRIISTIFFSLAAIYCILGSIVSVVIFNSPYSLFFYASTAIVAIMFATSFGLNRLKVDFKPGGFRIWK